MALTQDQAADAWSLFKDTALWIKWPEIQTELSQRLSSRTVKAGQPVYRPDEPADYLYMIRSGAVEQTIGRQGRAWFRRRLGRGQFFGQHSLFSGTHHTGAMALEETELFLMSAADLRVALERNSELREVLLREKLANRLRSIPLFQCIANDDIGWLALLIQEKSYGPGAAVGLRATPGLWVIDWGQVTVSVPAACDQPDWRLTAGNFFLSPGVADGYATVADSALASLKTRLFYLAGDHFKRLAATYTDVARIASFPVDILGELRNPLAGPGMTDAHFRHLAQICAWSFVPSGQNISTQGTIGYSFIVIRRGSAVVRALDNEGRSRPQNFLREGSAFGLTSLLESKPRDATVRAVASTEPSGSRLLGTEILDLDRRDLRFAFAQAPELWHASVWLYDRSELARDLRPTYPWQEEGEVVTWDDRPHWLWLVLPQIALVTVAVVLMVALSSSGVASPLALGLADALLLAFILLPVAGVLLANYFNDYYVVTNRRVTRRDRRLLVYEERIDAPLDTVQDVTVDTNLMGRIFDYGNVAVRTAAKVGAISFRNVPRPEDVKNLILQERAGAVAAARGEHKEILRRSLVDGLHVAQPIAEPDQVRALGPDVARPEPRTFGARLRAFFTNERKPRPQVLPGAKRPRSAWLTRVTGGLPKRVQYVLLGPPVPAPRPNPNQIVWRKHWLNLVQRAGGGFVSSIALLVLMFLTVTSPGDLLGPIRSGVLLAGFLFLIPAFLWFLWNYVDWSNDIYVVTDEKIIDIDRKPLGLRSSRRESALDRIQNVSSQQNGLLAYIFNYGNVVIQTAAADAGFTFTMVGHPQNVQRTIFSRVDAYRRQQEEKQVSQRQREMIEGLQVYHEMLKDKEQGRI